MVCNNGIRARRKAGRSKSSGERFMGGSSGVGGRSFNSILNYSYGVKVSFWILPHSGGTAAAPAGLSPGFSRLKPGLQPGCLSNPSHPSAAKQSRAETTQERCVSPRGHLAVPEILKFQRFEASAWSSAHRWARKCALGRRRVPHGQGATAKAALLFGGLNSLPQGYEWPKGSAQ